MVGIFTSDVAIPVKYPNNVVACSTLYPATSNLCGTINKSIFETIGSIIFANDTGIAKTKSLFIISKLP